jgi:cysteine-rich repeat protein
MLFTRTSSRGARAAGRSPLPAALALALVPFLAAACGDNYAVPMPDAGPMDAPPDSGLDEEGCRILGVGPRDFQFNLFDQLLGVRFPVTPNLDGARGDVLHVDLFDSTTPDLPPLTPGAFDLSASTDLATCQHCVWVEVDATDDGTVDAIYFATSGTFTVDKISDPLDAVFAAHTGRVVLRRATVGDNGHSTLVPGGDCVSIAALSFDTSRTPGKACESAEDCGNALLEVCDPDNLTCGEPQCDFDNPCQGAGEQCFVQYKDLFFGACYQTCNPSSQAAQCAGTQRCVQLGLDTTFGICKHIGSGGLGSTCEVEDNSTSCSGKGLCSSQSHTCAEGCSFYEDDPGCTGSTMCSLFGLCEPASVGKAVALGAACGADAVQVQGCAPDGDAFRGICFGFEDEPLICEKACLGDQGCTTGEFCAMRFSSGLGICRPLPVCGDGARGEINEACDDGNTADGDGCSGDCTTVDVNWLCGNAPALAFSASTQGNTATARDGLMSSCQIGEARASLYRITPPGPGRLRVHVTSPSSQTLSLRTDCSDGATELGCGGDYGLPTDQELIVQITDTTPAALTAMVSAMTVLEEDTFTIAAEFVPELCGDGVIAGREVCDDDNTTSGDGCSNDCRTIEYGVLCTQAPVLSTTATNTGDLTGAPALYEASCAIDDGAATRPSRMFRYVAPAAGNLHLKLTDGTSFAVLSVRDGCGAPSAAPEQACRPAFLDGEIDVTLAAGETVTAVVTNYRPDGIGTFTLDATFTAQ